METPVRKVPPESRPTRATLTLPAKVAEAIVERAKSKGTRPRDEAVALIVESLDRHGR